LSLVVVVVVSFEKLVDCLLVVKLISRISRIN
jgi:hypothetical protein